MFQVLRRRLPWSRWLVLAASAAVVPLIMATHWSGVPWQDEHTNYPNTPTGYSQIVNTFGQPCSAAAHDIHADWIAANNGQTYRIWFHRKLGGRPTAAVADQGGRSTNLDNDIWGHINERDLNPWVKSGIYGYNCRYIAGTHEWSTHAWGIAVDVSSSFEPQGSHTSTTNYHHADIWEHHGWEWGKVFGDPMHFQYATGY